MLRIRRGELMEKLARGISDDNSHHVHVGRCKELAETIEKITQQIRSLGGLTDDEDKSGK